MSHSALPPGSPTRGFWHHLRDSTYVTTITDWFLGFFGKAAHLVLILTTLYTGSELLPGVSLPAAMNNGVFVVQMLVLDVGGMGLAKLAMQARDEGNETGAAQAERLSRWLIRIVIVSLVTVAVEQAVRAIPGLESVSSLAEGVNVAIGGALTIARAICAVHYGRVMHLLRTAEDESPPLPAVEVEQLMRLAVSDLTAQVLNEQHQALAQFRQDIESRLSLSEETIERRLLSQIDALLHAQVSALLEAVQSQARPLALSEPPDQSQSQQAKPPDQNQGQEPGPLALSVSLASRPAPEARATSASDVRLQAASDLLVERGERLSGRALAREAHVSRATASKWLAKAKGQQEEPEAVVEASEQIEAIPEGQSIGVIGHGSEASF